MKILKFVFCACVLLLFSTISVLAQEVVPGTDFDNLGPSEVHWGSILPEITETGKISLSIDGLGTLTNNGIVKVEKPAGATVRGAYFIVASMYNSPKLPSGTSIYLNGTGVTWIHEVGSSIYSWNYWADVTPIVKPTIDAAPAGIIEFPVVETNTNYIDGSILAVIFDDPNQTYDNTIVLLFGAQQTTGDQFNIGLAEPIDTSDPNFKLDMSLGISFGYQLSSYPSSSAQYSIVDVNDLRLTTSAGGQDDGAKIVPAHNGSLITVGGIGDSNANPPDPYAYPGMWSMDDELYNLLPFVEDGDTQIKVDTLNPSNDDNIFFAAFFLGSTTAVVGEGILLAQEFDTNPVGSDHTVTATLQDDDGNPIVDRLVSFNVLSGPHAGTNGSQATDSEGKAYFTYTGTAAGTDVIAASFINNQQETIESNQLEKVWVEEQEYELISVFDAAERGMMSMYCYIWDNVNNCYKPISSLQSDNTLLPPWTGYYVLVNTDLDLLTPDNGTPAAVADLEILNDRYYLISPPVDPAANRDINANWGDNLGDGNYERTWRTVKWRYLEEDYIRYNGPTANTFMDLHAGRGFYLLQLTGSTVMLDMPGDPAPTTEIEGVDYHMVKMPGPVANTGHMAGNPFAYGIYWKNCMVRVPMSASQLSKIAAVDTENLDTWYVGLTVRTSDNSAKDLYNRAGIVESSGIDADFLDAVDMAPMGEYVNLRFVDQSGESALAYDYQSDGALQYQWDIELTTSFSSVDAELSLNNFENVPEDYIISLQDKQTGEIYQITGDESINVSLSSGISREFVMTAEKHVVSVDENSQPLTFGITGVSPNPFNPVTSITYTIEKSNNVKIQVFNLNGQLIETLVDGFVNTGKHSVIWDAGNYASGIYIISAQTNGMRDVRKVTLVK